MSNTVKLPMAWEYLASNKSLLYEQRMRTWIACGYINSSESWKTTEALNTALATMDKKILEIYAQLDAVNPEMTANELTYRDDIREIMEKGLKALQDLVNKDPIKTVMATVHTAEVKAKQEREAKLTQLAKANAHFTTAPVPQPKPGDTIITK